MNSIPWPIWAIALFVVLAAGYFVVRALWWGIQHDPDIRPPASPEQDPRDYHGPDYGPADCTPPSRSDS